MFEYRGGATGAQATSPRFTARAFSLVGYPGAIPGKVGNGRLGGFAVASRPELRENKEMERFSVLV